MENYKSAVDYLTAVQPSDPVICHRPQAALRSARWFLKHFPGKVLYAVKANSSPIILQSLCEAGIAHFDVSSPEEIALLSAYRGTTLYCMNPVKHPAHIRIAYFDYGVRDFALDTHDELQKILASTENAQDLNLHVRLSVDNSGSRLPLGSKYGIAFPNAADLLITARLQSKSLGLSFHVGSQSMSPASYTKAIEYCSRIVKASEVILDTLDVGGGFPSVYPDLSPPPMAAYLQSIIDAFKSSLTNDNCELLCEPGRALVAESASVLTNVTLRKGDNLYINDGAYGSLFDASHIGFVYPARAIRGGQILKDKTFTPFRLFGPTCDSIDYMPGPFLLPSNIQAGDYIEIGQLGAYGDVMRTNFNGFGARQEIIVNDEPMLSLYSDSTAMPRVAEQ
jgi:ornithine decarboxylase